jgi:hypothetical protein
MSISLRTIFYVERIQNNFLLPYLGDKFEQFEVSCGAVTGSKAHTRPLDFLLTQGWHYPALTSILFHNFSVFGVLL